MNASKIIKSVPNPDDLQRQSIPVGDQPNVAFTSDSVAGPQVECVREDGVIRRVEVRCECGCTIDLVCDYESD